MSLLSEKLLKAIEERKEQINTLQKAFELIENGAKSKQLRTKQTGSRQTQVLAIIKANKGVSPKEVAEKLNATNSTASSALWVLKKKGLIKQTKDGKYIENK